MIDASLVPRFAARRLAEALTDSPAVLIHGPRQCGKTTLAQALCAPSHLPGARSAGIDDADGQRYAYLTLDDRAALAAASADPVGFVADLPPRVVLDEMQRAPELMSAIKVSIDRDRRPGRFVLTGSTNVLSLPRLADSLAGRMEIVRLHPSSQRCRRSLRVRSGALRRRDQRQFRRPPARHPHQAPVELSSRRRHRPADWLR